MRIGWISQIYLAYGRDDTPDAFSTPHVPEDQDYILFTLEFSLENSQVS